MTFLYQAFAFKNYEVRSVSSKDVRNEVYCGLFVTKQFLSQTKFVIYSPSLITLHYCFSYVPLSWENVIFQGRVEHNEKQLSFFQTRASLSGGLPELGREVGGIGVGDRRPTTPNTSFI